MRLLFLSNYYPPYDLGGYEQLCQEVGEGFVRRGHEVRVLTTNRGHRGTDLQGQIRVQRALWELTDVDFYRPMDFFLRRTARDRHNLATLEQEIGEFDPSAILVWGMWNLSLEVIRHAERCLPQRVLYYLCSYWPIDKDPHVRYWNMPARHAGLQPLKAALNRLANWRMQLDGYPPKITLQRAACCSNYVKERLSKAGVLSSSSEVICNGISADWLEASQNQEKKDREDGLVRLVYLGRLIQDKGVHTAIEAIGILKDRGFAERITVTIIGSGHPDYEREIKGRVKQLGLDQKVTFIKQVPRESVRELLQKHEVCLFTSVWEEPMARSVMEAMAVGLMVIGTRVGGQTEMLTDGKNSLTYEAGNADQLAQKIMRVLQEPSLRSLLAANGRETIAKRYTLKRMLNGLEDFLNRSVRSALK